MFIVTPILYCAIKSIYKINSDNLGKVLWYDDNFIKPYFIAAGRELTYSNLYAQLKDSLLNKSFPLLSEDMKKDVSLNLVVKETIINIEKM